MALLPPAAAAGARGRVFLVGVDGGSWNVIDPMLAAGELPGFAALAERGVTGALASVEPVNSPAVWSTLATGRRPLEHGVTDFQATRLTLRVPTVFERLAVAGRRVGLYEYLVTWPPPELPGGFAIPGWLRHDDRVAPADVWERAGVTPFVMRYQDGQTAADFIALAEAEMREKAPRWLRLAEAFDLDVGAVTFYAVDTLSHRLWHAAYPGQFSRAELPEGEPPASEREALRAAVRGVDRALASIQAALAPEDVLLVASDHGFRAAGGGIEPVWIARVEAWLAAAGLEPARDAFNVVTRFGIVIVHVHEGSFAAREETLGRLVALLEDVRGPDGSALFAVDVIDAAERPPGAERPLWRRLRQWGIRQVMRHVYHMSTERPGHAYVFARPRDAALAALWPDGEVRVAGRALAARDAFFRDGFSGVHDATGIFLAAGGPIRARRERVSLSVLELAPLLLHLAGAPVPDDIPAALRTDLLRADALAARPPARVPAAALPGLPAPRGAQDPAVDPELAERLRRLGYLR